MTPDSEVTYIPPPEGHYEGWLEWHVQQDIIELVAVLGPDKARETIAFMLLKALNRNTRHVS